MSNYYINEYTSYENNDKYITVYKGIFDKKSTNSDVIYQCVYPICCINLTERLFYISDKFSRKIHEQTDNNIVVDNTTYTHMDNFFNGTYKESEILDILKIIHQCDNEEAKKNLKKNSPPYYY
jgi:hypothetical protein